MPLQVRPTRPFAKSPLPSARKGRYVALNSKGVCLAQGNKVAAVMAEARAKGCAVPIFINLDIRKERTYIF